MKSVDQLEIDKFSDLADQWWDEKGKFKALHVLNPLRIKYIKDKTLSYFQKSDKSTPFSGLSFLDVGCGGGILSEPIARLGASVLGIDASDKAIEVAKAHAKSMGLKISYECLAVENLVKKKARFDVVMAMEIVEHVADLDSFMSGVCKLVKPGGILFVATINRTVKSYLAAIIGAEYILRWVPIGTHDWSKFLKPSEIAEVLFKNELSIADIKGCAYNPIASNQWSLSENLDINYMMMATRNK
jgi:2-polyprenyl-6-hydroxyphenyl methylase/3-demethylubiquinone-9 3-methyltransferase